MQDEQETLWYLEDTRELADAEPYTFYVPSAEVLAALQPGESVQLVFHYEVDDPDEDPIERLWVRITEIDGDDFAGELETPPTLIPDLEPDDEIEFTSYHITDTQREDPVANIVQQYTQGCYVSARVIEDEQPVGALYRENPDELEEEIPDFSGWNIMAGDEDDDYLDNPDNWLYVSLGTVLNIDDRFIDLLDAPYGSEFEYDPEQDTFVEVEDEVD